MNSGKIVADGTGGRDGTSKVLQEVLADLKRGERNEHTFPRPVLIPDQKGILGYF